MTGYKDMTFCPFWETCKEGKTCFRALTDKVREDAKAWWDGLDAPICQYISKPDCHTTKTVASVSK